MNVRVKKRWQTRVELALYLIVLAILEVAIGYGIFQSFQVVKGINQFPVTFGNMTNDYLRIATHLEASVVELNDLVVRSALRHDPADGESFAHKSQNLKTWIAGQKSSSPQAKFMMWKPVQLTVYLGTLVNEIDIAYDAYLQEAKRIVKRSEARDGQAVSPTDLGQLQKKSQQLLALGNEARAQADAIQIFLSGSGDWLKLL